MIEPIAVFGNAPAKPLKGLSPLSSDASPDQTNRWCTAAKVLVVTGVVFAALGAAAVFLIPLLPWGLSVATLGMIALVGKGVIGVGGLLVIFCTHWIFQVDI